MSVKHIKKSEYEQEVLNGFVLVDFWAPWCGPCKMLSPVLDEVAKELEGKLRIVKINVDEEQELANELGVMGIPALFLFKDGERVDQAAGFMPKEALLSFIERKM